MHASAASCRRATRGTTWTLPWAPSDGSGQSWDSSSLQVLSRVRGLNRRAIAFSGRIPYFGGRFLTIEESSHAGSHGHGGTAAGRGRHPRGPAPLPVRDRRVRKLHAVRPRPPARQPDRRRGPDRLLDHRLAGDRGGWTDPTAAPEGRRSRDGLPGVVRFGEHRAQLRLGEELLHPGRLLGHGFQQQWRRGLPGRRRARGDRRPDLRYRPRRAALGGRRVLRAQDAGSRRQPVGRPACRVSGAVVLPRPQPSRIPVSRSPQGEARLDPRGGPTYEQRSSDWQHKWYWGGEAGILVFRTNYDSYSFEPTFGGHWLITGKRTALYASFEQSLFISPRHVTIVEPSGAVTPGNVQFANLRRIMVGVLAFPAQLRVEPFAGGGFAIMEALNVQVSCASCTGSDLGQLQDEADRAATKAFFWWMGGVDIKQGRLALYGQYILTSAAANFLIQGTTHTFQGGVRYSLGSSKEGVTDRQ